MFPSNLNEFEIDEQLANGWLMGALLLPVKLVWFAYGI